MDPDWMCAACKDGRHGDCDFWRGCECTARLGPDGRGVRVCESLLPYNGEDWHDR